MNISGIWQNITDLWKPVVRENRTTDTDQSIKEYAPERIRRSPGHQNIAELSNEEPEWYHE